MSRGQMQGFFGGNGLFMQRGMVGASRVQQLLQAPVFSQALDLAAFGTLSTEKALWDLMCVYAQPFRAFRDDAGLEAVCSRDERLTKIDPGSLRAQCLSESAYPNMSDSEHRFFLFPVESLHWVGKGLVATKSEFAPNIPPDAKVPTLGLVLSYVRQAMNRNAFLPRYIFVQHALLPGTEHNPRASYQLLVEPYEERQITIIEAPFSTGVIDESQPNGKILKEFFLSRICEIMGLDKRRCIRDQSERLSFRGQIALWTGVMSCSDLSRDPIA